MIAKYRNFSLAMLAGMCLVFTAGCGDTFRNFITPIPKQTGDPAGLSHAVVTSVNSPTSNGSDLHINVSGDSIAGLVPAGGQSRYAIGLEALRPGYHKCVRATRYHAPFSRSRDARCHQSRGDESSQPVLPRDDSQRNGRPPGIPCPTTPLEVSSATGRLIP